MKKYEIYKDSGIEWIGEIPEGWKCIKLGWLYPNMGSGTTPDTNNLNYYSENGTNWLQTGDLNDGMIIKTSKHITDLAIRERGLKIYPTGSVVIAMYGATIGKVGLLNIDTTTNQACCVLPMSEDMNNRFLFYVMQASKSSLVSKSIGGGQPNISQSIIKEHKIPVPSLNEQQAIASYLDHKVSQIDASVSAINTQIDDLKAYRQSIISEAVTKGLYSDVKMKDSGIEGGWSIPVHWSSNRLKFLADIVRGGSPRPIEEYIADEGYNWIKIGDTIKGYKYIESTKEKIKPSGLNATREVHVNDLILSNSMSFGQPYILKIDGCIHDGWLAFTNYKGLDKEYLYYVLQAGVCSCQFEYYVAGGVVQNLNIEKVATTRIPLPPLAEQQSIATYLDKKTAQIDSSIDSLEVQRDDLNALKQSIVSEAVTGKIDLRDWKLKK